MSDSWEEQGKLRIYNYKCECGHITKRTRSELGWDGEVWEERPMTWTCEICGEKAEYAGFDPIRTNYVVKTSFEKNGRLGYRYGDGTVISKTKDNYLKTGDTTSQVSSSYRKTMEGRVDQATKDFHNKIKK